MKASELARLLLLNPDYDVSISIDVSINDEDRENRAFSESLEEVMVQNSVKEIVLVCTGYTNF